MYIYAWPIFNVSFHGFGGSKRQNLHANVQLMGIWHIGQEKKVGNKGLDSGRQYVYKEEMVEESVMECTRGSKELEREIMQWQDKVRFTWSREKNGGIEEFGEQYGGSGQNQM